MATHPSPCRRFQFRLRTLLIVVTLLAVACWVVVDRQPLIRERDDAVRRESEARQDAENKKWDADELKRQMNDLADKFEKATGTTPTISVLPRPSHSAIKPCALLDISMA